MYADSDCSDDDMEKDNGSNISSKRELGRFVVTYITKMSKCYNIYDISLWLSYRSKSQLGQPEKDVMTWLRL